MSMEGIKAFQLSFESAEPDWNRFEFAYFQDYPSVKLKLQNLSRLKSMNQDKLKNEKLEQVFR